MMTALARETITVDGTPVTYLSGGSGEPLVFFHGAGTFHGFAFAEPWTENYRVHVPFHPGFGESADDDRITDMHDYVMHYMELFDRLELEQVNLVGFSLGGWMAARLCTEFGHRIRRLVLVAPAGLRDPENPTVDIFKLKPDEIVERLAHNFEVLRPHLPEGHDVDFIVDRYREMSSTARVAWERLHDPKLTRYLHRITVPTMILWGDKDRIIPVGQAATWAKSIPDAKVHIVPDAGHLVLDEKPEAVTTVSVFFGAAC